MFGRGDHRPFYSAGGHSAKQDGTAVTKAKQKPNAIDGDLETTRRQIVNL